MQRTPLIAIIVCLCLLFAGCNDTPVPSDPPTPTVRRAAKTHSDPLTEAEVQTFLAVIADLPGGVLPPFAPLAQPEVNDRLSGAHLADVYRREYRAMFDAARHGERWRKDPPLMSTFKTHDVEPEDFAALMIRMSCAVAADTVSPRVDLNDTATRAEQQIQEISTRLDRFNAAPLTPETKPQRQRFFDALLELVALSEFSRMLQSVPHQSRELITRHRTALAKHLPAANNAEMFERTEEATVIPTSFEQ